MQAPSKQDGDQCWLSDYRCTKNGTLCSDIPAKVYIVSLNQQKEPSEKFILEDLDDTHLFVQPAVIEWLKTRLKEFQDQNTYQPPRKDN
jgi:TFIIH basal transcription factor complex TTD-A subunit